jgi:single-strand DNA-binding protein
MNNICIVGKVITLPELRETVNGSKVASLEVEVERNFPNSEGLYESDVFLVTLWKGLAESCTSLCEVNSVVGIKGRLAAKNFDTKEGGKFYNCEIICEKMSFIAK